MSKEFVKFIKEQTAKEMGKLNENISKGVTIVYYKLDNKLSDLVQIKGILKEVAKNEYVQLASGVKIAFCNPKQIIRTVYDETLQPIYDKAWLLASKTYNNINIDKLKQTLGLINSTTKNSTQHKDLQNTTLSI